MIPQSPDKQRLMRFAPAREEDCVGYDADASPADTG